MLPHSLYSGQENARVLFERKTCEEYGMKLSEFAIVRLACAYFFICPGITYGIFTSRLPALKAQTGANEAQIGLVLLCFGGASLISLFSSSWFLKKVGKQKFASLWLNHCPHCGYIDGYRFQFLFLGTVCHAGWLRHGLCRCFHEYPRCAD